MKNHLLPILFLAFSLQLVAQNKSTNFPIERNTIYAEAFGQGFCYSLNYDRLFNIEKKVYNSFTVGMTYAPKKLDFGDGSYLGIPISYNWLFGKKSHHLELGIGFTGMLVNSSYNNNSFAFYTYLTPKIGYRFQRPQGGLFLKVSATPMIDLISFSKQNGGLLRLNSVFSDVVGLGYRAFPWPGFSIGYTFK